MKTWVSIWMLLFGSLIILVACTDAFPQPTAACDDINDKRLVEFPFAGETTDMVAWIENQYELSPSDISRGLSGDHALTFIEWSQAQDQINSALVWNDVRESASVTRRWLHQQPAVRDALRCLGDPPMYRAYHGMHPEAVWTYLELWYPDQGIIVTAFTARKTLKLTGKEAIAVMEYVEPGPVPELVSRAFWTAPAGSTPYYEILRGVKAWPGDIGQVTIDEPD